MKRIGAKLALFLAVGVILFLRSCRENTPSGASDSTVAKLPALTAALMAEVRWADPAMPVADDNDLLESVFKKRGDLRTAFEHLQVRMWHDSKDVFVVVCSPDGATAWLEDASWTPGVVDDTPFESQPAIACPAVVTPPERPSTTPASGPSR